MLELSARSLPRRRRLRAPGAGAPQHLPRRAARLLAPKKLTPYDQDDGIEITNLAWSKDALSLIFVRGGDPNRRGERPNPTSNPAGAKQQVHLINLQTGDIRLVGEGHDPAVAVEGRSDLLRLFFGRTLRRARFRGGEARSILKTRGGISPGDALARRPASRFHQPSRRSRLPSACTTSRPGRSLIPTPRSIPTPNPVFSPDGARLAFLREAADSLSPSLRARARGRALVDPRLRFPLRRRPA